MKLILKRISSTQNGTFGVLIKDTGEPLCVTLEDPWNNNERNISCIPAGKYKVVPHNGAKYKNVWRLKNVPNRTAILIHIGNSIMDTSGCILVGRSFNANTIRDSRNAFEFLKAILPDRFTLVIEDVKPKTVTKPLFWDIIKSFFKGD